MPIREYRCPKGHKTQKLDFSPEPVAEKPCPTCAEDVARDPMFAGEVETAELVTSAPFTPSSDFKKAEARAKYKAGAGEAR